MLSERHVWPADRLGEALETLARRSGLAVTAVALPRAPTVMTDDELAKWVSVSAHRLGIEAEPVDCAYPEPRGGRASCSVAS